MSSNDPYTYTLCANCGEIHLAANPCYTYCTICDNNAHMTGDCPDWREPCCCGDRGVCHVCDPYEWSFDDDEDLPPTEVDGGTDAPESPVNETEDTMFGRMLTAESFLAGELTLDAACDRLRDVHDVPEPIAYLIGRLKARPGFNHSCLTLTRFGATESVIAEDDRPYGRTVLDTDYDPDVTTWDEQALPSVEDVENPRGLIAARSTWDRLIDDLHKAQAHYDAFTEKAKDKGWSKKFVERVQADIDRKTGLIYKKAEDLKDEFGRYEIITEQPLTSEYDLSICKDVIDWLHRDGDPLHDVEVAKLLGLENADEFSSIRAMRRADWEARRLAERKAELHGLCKLLLGEDYTLKSELVLEWAKTRSGRFYPKKKTTLAALVADRISEKDGNELSAFSSLCASMKSRLNYKGVTEDTILAATQVALAMLAKDAHEYTSVSGYDDPNALTVAEIDACVADHTEAQLTLV